MRPLTLLLVVAAVASCAKADGALMSRPGGPRALVVTDLAMLPGDTIAYGVSWTAPAVVAGVSGVASSYDVGLSVAASNGTWAVVADSNGSGKWLTGNGVGPLPSTGNATFTTLKMWLSAVPWDSATFTVSVLARNAAGVSAPATASWKVVRKRLPPGVPGIPKVDSTGTVLGTLVRPDTVTLALNTGRTVCAFKQFSTGAIAQWTADKPACDSIYTRAIPLPARTLVTAAQQAHTDSTAITCVAWSSALPAALQVGPRAPCAASATVLGLALTLRAQPDGIRLREANLREEDGPVLFIHPQTGVYRCLRAGVAYVRATSEDGTWTQVPVTCNPPLPEVLAGR